MEGAIILIVIVATIVLGLLGAWGYIAAMRWAGNKQREAHVERAVRQDVMDAESRRKAAQKILAERGVTK